MSKMFISEFGKIEYENRDFESKCFKNKTLEIYNWKTERTFKELFDSYISEQSLSTGDLVYTRKAANDTKYIQEANSAGFYYVETSIEPYINTVFWDRSRFADVITNTFRANEDDKAELMEIAKGMFKDLRFSLDLSIGNDLADSRYSKWMNNLIDDNKDIQLLMDNGKIVGFMAMNHTVEKTVWILGGTRKGYQGQGLGIALYASALDYCVKRGVKNVVTGISVSNIPVLGLYSKLGFRFGNPTVVLHYNA